jgi:surface polysaccharide O-acyltransferase-like enzyme
MESDNIENFSVFLNSQASSNGATVLQGTAGEVQYKINGYALIPQKFRRVRFKVNINFASNVVAGTTLTPLSMYYMEINAGSQVFNMYGLKNNNSITLPLEVYVVGQNTGVLTTTSSSTFLCKNCFTGYLPSDTIIVRIRNASDDSIATAFPHYLLNIVYEPIIHEEFA